MKVDSNEPKKVRRYLEARGHTVERLPFGDYWIERKGLLISIERKSTPDFIKSVWDERLKNQLHKNLEGADAVVLLLEGRMGVGRNGYVYQDGKNTGIPHASLLSGLTYIALCGVTVMWNPSEDALTTAAYLDRLDTQLTTDDLPGLLTRGRQKLKIWTKLAPPEQALVNLKVGLGPSTAPSVIEACGTISKLFSMSRAELCSLPGVGPTIAKRILTIGGNHGEISAS